MSTTSKQVFQRFVPSPAVDYCDQLYNQLNFEFKIKKSRKTKMGDFRLDHRTGHQTITINNDLNPYSFLITYLHEVAHLLTFEQYGRKVAPHGQEWKNMFKKTLQPVLNEQNFPPDILQALTQHFASPKATSCSDPALYQILRKYDEDKGEILLKEVPIGGLFEFNGKTYQKLEVRRTRAICQELKSKRKYLIALIAGVVEETS
ncbi:MAG: SprT-like domain-containing protein [Cytophagales bacterium]|nr:SprT-like domain-containing protein [Cytophagales bacterium]